MAKMRKYSNPGKKKKSGPGKNPNRKMSNSYSTSREKSNSTKILHILWLKCVNIQIPEKIKNPNRKMSNSYSTRRERSNGNEIRHIFFC